MPTPGFAKRMTSPGPHQLGACVLLLLAAVLLPAATAAADPFPVTSTADSGPGSLRAAIEAANLHPGPDSIPISATGTINLETAALPTISDNVDISGPGQSALTVRRNAVADFRIFDIGAFAVSISGMTIADGRATEGAGIKSLGTLTLTRVTVAGNEAVSKEHSFTTAVGGGIFSLGPLTMRESTVSGNTATATEGTTETLAQGGGVESIGGALLDGSTVSGNTAQATSTVGEVIAESAGLVLVGAGLPSNVERSTISGNSASASGGLTNVASGGGLTGKALTITSSTVTANSVTSTGQAAGANLDAPADTVVRDTIVSNPTGGAPSCALTVISAGFNIDEDSSCGFTQSTDLSGMDPGLDPTLAANGGPTLTHALLPGSMAIDRGNAFGATTDQRGFPRPSDFLTIPNTVGGDGSDIGAFEVQAPVLSPPPPPPDTVAPDTRIAHGPAHLTRRRLAVFRFSSSEAGSRFECKLDRDVFRSCTDPFQRKVKAGAKHAFLVRAIDAAGNVDPSAAKYVWRVKRPSRPRDAGK